MGNVLVVGGSKGIGFSIVNDLLAKGHHVTAVARDTGPLEALSEEKLTIVGGNALEAKTIKKAVEMAAANGSITGLTYCVGTILLKPVNALKDEEFLDAFEKNVLGAIRWVKEALPELKKDGGGAIVLFSTTAARIGLPNHTLVATVKGAVEGFARSLAADVAPNNVRVNVLANGLIDTPLAKPLTSSDAALQASIKIHPLGRIGQPEEPARFASLLLTEEGSFVTGQIIAIDGGVSSIKPRIG